MIINLCKAKLAGKTENEFLVDLKTKLILLCNLIIHNMLKSLGMYAL